MSGQVERSGNAEQPIITGSDDQSPPNPTAGSGSTPTPKGKAGSGHIETPSSLLPPAPAEASRSPAPLPNQNMKAVGDSAVAAVKAFLDAKAELSAREADTTLRHGSLWEQKVAILRPMALLLTNNYYVRAEENAAVTALIGLNAEIDGDLDKADRLRGQARETMRSFAEDADEPARVALNLARTSPGHWPAYEDAALKRVSLWQDALHDAEKRGDAEEIEKCRTGLRNACSDVPGCAP